MPDKQQEIKNKISQLFKLRQRIVELSKAISSLRTSTNKKIEKQIEEYLTFSKIFKL